MKSRSDPEFVTDLIMGCLKHDPTGWKTQVQDLLEQHGYLNAGREYTSHLIDEMYLFDELCSSMGSQALDHSQEALFTIGSMLNIPDGKVADHMARLAFWKIQVSANNGKSQWNVDGQATLNWLLDHRELATRRDLGTHQDQGAVGLLMESWHEEPTLGVSQTMGWSREWASAFLAQVVLRAGSDHPVTIDQGVNVLCQEGRAQAKLADAQVNPGLFLALMDQGAPWEEALSDPDIREDFKAAIRTHPAFVRAQLIEVVAGQPRSSLPRRGM